MLLKNLAFQQIYAVCVPCEKTGGGYQFYYLAPHCMMCDYRLVTMDFMGKFLEKLLRNRMIGAIHIKQQEIPEICIVDRFFLVITCLACINLWYVIWMDCGKETFRDNVIFSQLSELVSVGAFALNGFCHFTPLEWTMRNKHKRIDIQC